MPWSDAVLATDADLKRIESRMPEQAQRSVSDDVSSYDGKRAFAKERITQRLWRTQIDPNTLSDPGQLRMAAAYLELSLIYWDMARGTDALSAQKAAFYQERYEEEISGIRFSLDTTTEPETRRARAVLSRA